MGATPQYERPADHQRGRRHLGGVGRDSAALGQSWDVLRSDGYRLYPSKDVEKLRRRLEAGV